MHAHVCTHALDLAHMCTRAKTLSIHFYEFVGVVKSRALRVDLDVRAHLPTGTGGDKKDDGGV